MLKPLSPSFGALRIRERPAAVSINESEGRAIGGAPKRVVLGLVSLSEESAEVKEVVNDDGRGGSGGQAKGNSGATAASWTAHCARPVCSCQRAAYAICGSLN